MAQFHVFVINGKARNGGDGLDLGMGRKLRGGRGSFAERKEKSMLAEKWKGTLTVDTPAGKREKRGRGCPEERDNLSGCHRGLLSSEPLSSPQTELYLCVITDISLASMMRASLNNTD